MTSARTHRAIVLAIRTLTGLILFTPTAAASAQEGTEPAPQPPCASFHADPASYRPSRAVQREVQRLMRPMGNGTQRSPRAISAALRRKGFTVGYADRPQDVAPGRQAVVREGTNLTTTVIAATILLGRGLLCPDGSVRDLPAVPNSATFAVRATSRLRLVPVRCLARDVARPASLPRAYLSAARSLLQSGHRRPRLIAALLTRRGYPTLPVPTIGNVAPEGVSLVLDRSSRRLLTIGYRRATCPAPPDGVSQLVTRIRVIR